MFTFSKLGRYGRLGNQMFQIAGTIGIAQRHNDTFAFPPWMNWDQKYPPEGATFPPSTEDIDVQKWFKNPLPVVPGNIAFNNAGIPWGYQEINLPQGDWDLEGHMQSEKYFLHAKDTIRHYFAFTDEKISEFGGRNGLADNTCCVLFRRGDYVQKNGYHPVIGQKFYERAMAEFPSDTKWIVFPENNEAEAREIIGNNAVYIDRIHSMDKMVIASQCRHFILPNGTFFWFPAWLGYHPDKKVVSVSAENWFGPEANGLSAADIIPNDWIQIKAN